jgi:D-beta-D-heptose 7-phosphate kinase/D-beta-D-heptose 1-phosphate adenosyltransferase
VHKPATIKEKITTLAALQEEMHLLRGRGARAVFTNGCFDILHAGHVNLLEEARALGDMLIVAMNSDRSVRGLKGPSRPIVPQQQRAEVLAALAAVDRVIVFDEPTPLQVISALCPQILVKGGDWEPQAIVGREVVEGAGGRVVSIALKYGASTTDIIDRIIKRAAAGELGDRGAGADKP